MNVLLIEDDEASAELLKLRLEALECTVEQTSSAEEALSRARQDGINLVICDLKLAHSPHNGIQLVQQLREDPQTREIPIVVHSIYVNFPSEAPEALPVVDGYLPKPFRFDELKSMIGEITTKQSAR